MLKQSSGNNKPNKVTARDLISLVVCAIPLEDCFLGACDRCGEQSPSSVLLRHFDPIDEDDTWSWSLWKTVNKKVDLHEIRGHDRIIAYRNRRTMASFFCYTVTVIAINVHISRRFEENQAINRSLSCKWILLKITRL